MIFSTLLSRCSAPGSRQSRSSSPSCTSRGKAENLAPNGASPSPSRLCSLPPNSLAARLQVQPLAPWAEGSGPYRGVSRPYRGAVRIKPQLRAPASSCCALQHQHNAVSTCRKLPLRSAHGRAVLAGFYPSLFYPTEFLSDRCCCLCYSPTLRWSLLGQRERKTRFWYPPAAGICAEPALQ